MTRYRGGHEKEVEGCVILSDDQNPGKVSPVALVLSPAVN